MQVFIFCTFISGFGLAQETVSTIGIADTNRFGNLTLYNLEGWTFSFDDPVEIKSRRNLSNTVPVVLSDLKELKSDPRWNKYGWFETEFRVDSSLVGIPWILSYYGQEPIKIWLNGILILKNGNVSKNPDKEVLSRYINKVQTGIMLNKGSNFLLVQYSEHTMPTYFRTWQWFDNGIYLVLYKDYEIFQRRQRAFIFGGAIMLLSLLVLMHTYLAAKFKGQYHTYVSLTTFFMLLHAFTSLSDTMVDWTYSYLYFAEFSYAVSFMFVVYFFLIAVRRIFELNIPWKALTGILVLSTIIGIASIFINREWLNILHPVLSILTLLYGIYSLWEAKQKSPENKIWIIATGILITVGGGILYVLLYIALGYQSNVLFILSILLAYTGVPISLTFNVAANYAALITTLETKVRERTTQLETANEYQKRFFANISHEFRTPLTISEGLINKVMRKEDLNQVTTKSDLSVVKRNMNRLHDMVNQIIDLTKSEQNHLTLHQKQYKADNLVSISIESFRSLAEYHGHTFQFHPDAGDAVLFVDRSKVEVIINNLISNAIKFTPDGGHIEITTRTESGNFILEVRDSGPGIPEGKEEVIFERFHRLSRPEEEYVEGMGVGLELSKTLAKLHGGEIVAVTGVENGAVFMLSLPLAEADDGELVQLLELEEEESLFIGEASNGSDSKGKYSVLLVEDNEDMMNYVADTLSEIGEIIRAGNGKEALNMLANYTPDIIITDLMMPVMGGQKLIENLSASKKWSNIPVIVLTAKALEDDKLHLLRYGVVDYISKPFQQEQLLLKIRNLLTYYNRRKKLKINLSLEEVPVKEDRLSEKVAAFIMQNLADTNLSVDSLADEFSQSRSSFYRNIQIETGMSPAELTREVRLTAARTMVSENKNLRLEELANAVGYKSATSFRKK
ncbi:MAG: response regulator, partial [Balneola sp.]